MLCLLRPQSGASDARSKVSLPAANQADLAPRLSTGSRSFDVARALQAVGVKALLGQRALSITRRVTLNVALSDSGESQNVAHRFLSFVSWRIARSRTRKAAPTYDEVRRHLDIAARRGTIPGRGSAARSTQDRRSPSQAMCRRIDDGRRRQRYRLDVGRNKGAALRIAPMRFCSLLPRKTVPAPGITASPRVLDDAGSRQPAAKCGHSA